MNENLPNSGWMIKFVIKLIWSCVRKVIMNPIKRDGSGHKIINKNNPKKLFYCKISSRTSINHNIPTNYFENTK